MSSSNFLLYVDSQFVSPYAMSAFVALHEKGLSFEIKTLNLAAQETNHQHFAALSLTRRVPTLVHNDFGLSESSAISEYLDEIIPEPPIYPRDPRAHARARQIQAWLRSDLMPIRKERPTEVVFCKPTEVPLPRRRWHPPKNFLLPPTPCFPLAQRICSAHGASPTPTWHSCSIGWWSTATRFPQGSPSMRGNSGNGHLSSFGSSARVHYHESD